MLSTTNKPENELFETIVSSAPEAREIRIEALSEPLSRYQFQDVTAVFHSILASAQKWGMASPEGSMLSELLSKVMANNEVYFDIFLNTFADQSKNRYFVGFAARYIKNLSANQKKKAIPSLGHVLLLQDIGDQADLIVDVLTTMQDESLNSLTVSWILPTAF